MIKQAAIVGTSFHRGAGDFIQRMKIGAGLALKREPANQYDKNAIAVMWGSRPLGYLPRGVAAELAPLMDKGMPVKAAKGTMPGCTITLSYEPPDAAR